MWKWFLAGFLALVLLCGGGGYLLVSSSGMFNRAVEPVLVRTANPERKNLTRSVSAPGIVESRSNRRISALVAARVKELPFKEGDEVNAGDTIVQLDDEEFQALLESAQAGLRSSEARAAQADVAVLSAEAALRSQEAARQGAEASYNEALSEVGRVRELFDSKDLAKSDLERAEAAFLEAQSRMHSADAAVEMAQQEIARARAELLAAAASVDIAKANIRRAQKDLDNCTIRSPIRGLITTLEAEVGELVLVGTFNNPASVIMEIADLSDMILKARVGESSIASVAVGQRARVFFNAYPDIVFEGFVERVGHLRQTWRDGTNYFEVDIPVTLRPEAPLRSGLSASSEIDVQTVTDALQVPSQAVVNRRVDELPREIVDSSPLIDRNKPFTTVVFIVQDGLAKATPVRVGLSDLTSTVILEGLTGTEDVIVGPYKELQKLVHDKPVTIEAPRSAAVAATEAADQDSGS